MSGDARFIFLTREQVSQPRSGLVGVIRDAWWPTTDDGMVALYVDRGFEAPQCNRSWAVAELLRLDPRLTGAPVLIPLAFVRHECDR